jgi:radical SAM superfamily enzyme YgiQ (UPF0313 family)
VRRLRVVLGDLAYINDANKQNLYVPLNVGLLASYAKRLFGRDIDVSIFKDPLALIQAVRDERADVVGLSHYYWKDRLNEAVIRRIRAHADTVVLGGPSIDTDAEEQAKLRHQYPGVDVLVTNEGEEAFASVLASKLGGSEIKVPLGLSTDLAKVPSPYLDGTLDPFLGGEWQPMIQTSRLCPYTCAFCVSGKSRGKLRAFPLEQVREELEYIGSRYHSLPEAILYVTDENFGILERDVDVARLLADVRVRHGYPQHVFWYNDKRFTRTSQAIHEIIGETCHHGVTLSLQSENPETLKAIKRRNLSDEQVTSAIGWARGLGLKTSTELIFGLPMETRDSFLALLDKCARFGFDAVNCYNLILFPGIEMNRAPYRAEHRLTSKRRGIVGSTMVLEGELIAESEEIVTSTTHFSREDYELFRGLNVLFHAIFICGLRRDHFRGMAAAGWSLTGMLREFLDPRPGADERHLRWLDDMTRDMRRELFDEEDWNASVARGVLPFNLKLQPVYAKRLVDERELWVDAAIDRLGQCAEAA